MPFSPAHAVLNGLLVGLPIVLAVEAAFRIAPGMPARARYLVACGAFALCVGSSVAGPWLGTGGGPGPSTPLQSAQLRLADGAGALASRVGGAGELAILAVWIAGTLLLLGRLALDATRLSRLRARVRWLAPSAVEGVRWPATVPLLVGSGGRPFAFGAALPAVYLPERAFSLDRDALVAVMRHELEHARWRDPLVALGLRIARSLLWPVAALWHLERLAARERELAADAAAVRPLRFDGPPDGATPPRGLDPFVYAGALVEIADWRWGRDEGAAVRGATTGAVSGLEPRIRSLLQPRRHGSRLRALAAMAVLLVGLGAGIDAPRAGAPAAATDGIRTVDRRVVAHRIVLQERIVRRIVH